MNYSESLDYLKQLLTINSVKDTPKENAPFGIGVKHCLDVALNILSKYGFKTKNIEGFCGYGEIGSGKLFGILSHLDVVPVGKGWHYDPFGATIENNKIYARGALDDKSPFIAMLWALTEILDEGLTPKMRIRFILGCDEESGWGCIDRYVKTEEMPEIGITPDADFPVINCEKGIFHFNIVCDKNKNIILASAGDKANMVPDYAEIKITKNVNILPIKNNKTIQIIENENDYTIISTGKSAHGSTPHKGENAIVKLLKAITTLSEFSEYIKLTSQIDDIKGAHANLDLSDDKSGHLSFNVGTMKTIEDKLVFEVDIRYPVTFEKDYILNTLKDNIAGEIIETHHQKPLYVDKDSFLVKTLLDSYNQVMNTNLEPISIGGGTYARALKCGVAFGPCFPNGNEGMHCPDEYMDLDDFKKMKEIYYVALKKLCF